MNTRGACMCVCVCARWGMKKMQNVKFLKCQKLKMENKHIVIKCLVHLNLNNENQW